MSQKKKKMQVQSTTQRDYEAKTLNKKKSLTKVDNETINKKLAICNKVEQRTVFGQTVVCTILLGLKYILNKG